MEVHNVDVASLVRMSLIFFHVMTVVAAGIGIAFGDYAIFARDRIDAALLHKAGNAVAMTLCGLWITGLAVIWLDTHFSVAALAAKPKLLAKLTVVVILSINGVALHRVAFKRLSEPTGNATRAAGLPAILGGVSAVTWVYAAFLGLAKPAAALLGFTGLMALYGVALLLGTMIALWLVRPRLAYRLTPRNREYALASVSILP